jgi:hypothetical protein
MAAGPKRRHHTELALARDELAMPILWFCVAILFLYLWSRTGTVNWFMVGGLFVFVTARMAWSYRKRNAATKTDASQEAAN